MNKVRNLKKYFSNTSSKERLEIIKDLLREADYYTSYCILEEQYSTVKKLAEMDEYEIVTRLLFAKVLMSYSCLEVASDIIKDVSLHLLNRSDLALEQKIEISLILITNLYDLGMLNEVVRFSTWICNETNLEDWQSYVFDSMRLLALLGLGTDVYLEFKAANIKALNNDTKNILDRNFLDRMQYEAIYFGWGYGYISSAELLAQCRRKIEEQDMLGLSYHFLVGECYLTDGFLKKSYEYLKENVSIDYLKKFNLYYLIWLPTFGSICINSNRIEDEIYIKCFPSYLYKWLLGGAESSESLLPPKLKKRLAWIEAIDKNNDKKNTALLLFENTLQYFDYSNITRFDSLLDLRSGIWVVNNQKIILSRPRLILIYCIISSGSRGANEIFLAEKAYANENILPKSTLLRVQDLITQLQKLDLPIIRKNKIVYFDYSKWNVPTVIPRNFEFEEEDSFFKQFFPASTHFDIYNVMTVLNIKRATASLYIKKWRTKGVIQRAPTRYGDWCFVSE